MRPKLLCEKDLPKQKTGSSLSCEQPAETTYQLLLLKALQTKIGVQKMQVLPLVLQRKCKFSSKGLTFSPLHFLRIWPLQLLCLAIEKSSTAAATRKIELAQHRSFNNFDNLNKLYDGWPESGEVIFKR